MRSATQPTGATTPVPQTYRVCLQGFTAFERNALVFCFRQMGSRTPAYSLVDSLPESDFILADADQAGVIERVVGAGRADAAVFVGQLAPLGASAHVARPIEPMLILRQLDALVGLRGAAAAPAPPIGQGVAEPPLLTEADILEADAPLPAPLVVERRTKLPPASPEARATAKAAARAAARRARRAQADPAGAAAPATLDVLVLEHDAAALQHLRALLEAFGFLVHPVAFSADAARLLAAQPFAAVFLDVVRAETDQEDGIDLCHRIKHAKLRCAGAPPPVLIVSDAAQSADRVRASLAGSEVFLTKPLTRGDVARSLESCQVSLPSDARRH